MAIDSFTAIATTPIGAKLYVNRNLVATTPYSALWFKAGDLIKIEKEGYETIQFILSLPQVGTELTFFLTPAKPPVTPAPEPASKKEMVEVAEKHNLI